MVATDDTSEEGITVEENQVIQGDCIEEMQKLNTNSVHAVVTDPPYGLAFMGKEWDDFEPKEYQKFCEACGEEAIRVLKPGGFLLAFSGTRTYHRMVCGLQDAGFEIRDMINWMYGQGFPKSYNFERFSQDWEGWGTALKPAHEPVVVAQTPREGTYQENVEQYGCGGLHIDACRVPAPDGGWTWGTQTDITSGGYGSKRPSDGDVKSTNLSGGEDGRWPANVILDPQAAAQLDTQTGELKSGVLEDHHNVENRMTQYCYGEYKRSNTSVTYGDSGGASRFFYSAKAAKSERNAGIEEENDIATLKPINLMRYLVRLVTPPNGTVLDPFAGSGTTGCACEVEEVDYLLIEKRERFANEIIPQRLNYWSQPENWTGLKEHNALPNTY